MEPKKSLKSYFIEPSINSFPDSINNESNENKIDFTNSIEGEKSSSKNNECLFQDNPTIPLQEEDDINSQELYFHIKKKKIGKRILKKRNNFLKLFIPKMIKMIPYLPKMKINPILKKKQKIFVLKKDWHLKDQEKIIKIIYSKKLR